MVIMEKMSDFNNYKQLCHGWHFEALSKNKKERIEWAKESLSRVEYWVSILIACWNTDWSTDGLSVSVNGVRNSNVSSCINRISIVSVSNEDWSLSSEEMMTAAWEHESWTARVSEAWWLSENKSWSSAWWRKATIGIGVGIRWNTNHFDWSSIGCNDWSRSNSHWDWGRGRVGRDIIGWNDVGWSGNWHVTVSCWAWRSLNWLSWSTISRSTRAQSWSGLAITSRTWRLLDLLLLIRLENNSKFEWTCIRIQTNLLWLLSCWLSISDWE